MTFALQLVHIVFDREIIIDNIDEYEMLFENVSVMTIFQARVLFSKQFEF